MMASAPAAAPAPLPLPLPGAGSPPQAAPADCTIGAKAAFTPMMNAVMETTAESGAGEIADPASQAAPVETLPGKVPDRTGTGAPAIGIGKATGPALLPDAEAMPAALASAETPLSGFGAVGTGAQDGPAKALCDKADGPKVDAASGEPATPDLLIAPDPLALPLLHAVATATRPDPAGHSPKQQAGDLSGAQIAATDAASPDTPPMLSASAQLSSGADAKGNAPPPVADVAAQADRSIPATPALANAPPSAAQVSPAPMPFLAGQITAPAAEPPLSPAAPDFAAQLGIRIAHRVTAGESEVIVRLNPAELGRIEVRLESGADGTLRISFQADSDRTLDIIRRDAGDLALRLHDAGLRTDSQSFSFAGGRQQPAQQDGSGHSRRYGHGWLTNQSDNNDTDGLPHDAARPMARNHGIYRHVDLTA